MAKVVKATESYWANRLTSGSLETPNCWDTFTTLCYYIVFI